LLDVSQPQTFPLAHVVFFGVVDPEEQ
jgi:hypothetical protein